MESKLNQKKINLIPSDMAVPAEAVKIAKVISKVSIVLVIVLILVSLSVAGLFIYFNNNLLAHSAKVESLKSKVTSLSQNEQKMVLAKDRLAKINIVQNAKSVNNEVDRFKEFSDIVSTSIDSNITEANLNTKGTEVTILSKSVTSLSEFIKPITLIKNYKTIILSSLSLNPVNGFTLTFNLSTE